MTSVPSVPSFKRYSARKVEIGRPADLNEFPHDKPFVARYKNKCPVDLYFYTEIKTGPILYVTFHGATNRGIDTYPRFDRVGSLHKKNAPYIAFADPGLGMDSNMELSWYLGGDNWDPKSEIIELIQTAMQASKSEYACLIGGSGGGFAALRVSHDIPNSLAFVFNPQIVLKDYIPQVRDYYFESMHAAGHEKVISKADPATYNLSQLYKSQPSENYVYYIQNMTDGTHVRNHYKPFKDAVGVADIHGLDSTGRIQLKLIDSSRFGHKPPSPEEFDSHLETAIQWVNDAQIVK